MLRRWATTAAGPVTRPFMGALYKPGDIVEVQTFEGVLKLGQVASSPTNGSDLVEVHFPSPYSSASRFSKLVKTPFIRFHRTPEHPLRFDQLESFRQATFDCLRDAYSKFQQVLQESRTALIYELDFAHRAFGKEVSTIQLYAVHIFLYGNVGEVCKDVGYKSVPLYHIRPAHEQSLLKGLKEIPRSTVEAFSLKLYSVLFDKKPVEFNADDKVLIQCLIAFASSTYINSSGPVENPFLETVSKAVYGICRPIPGEVHRVLAQLGLFPVLFDPAEHGSGVIQHPVQSSDRFYDAQNVEDTGLEEVEEEAIAIDSADTVEVDDAIRFDADGWLHVHVANSARLAQHGSELDLLARNRISTVYMPKQTLPMMPSSVSEQMSLSPGRGVNHSVTFSAKIGADGAILDYRVSTTLLKKVKRMTYEEADIHIVSSDPLRSGLALLDRHYQRRKATGHLPFILPKPSTKVDNDGTVKFRIQQQQAKEQSPAHKMVSEAMIVAGRVAAVHAFERGIPVPFRYHPAPPNLDPSLVERIRGGDASRYDAISLLTATSPSAVDTRPLSHWAMGLDMYAKATSPIRRYFDLLLHQQLRHRAHLSEAEVAALLPPAYRREQYLKQLQKLSTRYWTLKHVQSLLADPTHPDAQLLTTNLILLDGSSGLRQKVWVESLALILYVSLLGRVPAAGFTPGYVIDAACIVSVDPLKSHLELTIL